MMDANPYTPDEAEALLDTKAIPWRQAHIERVRATAEALDSLRAELAAQESLSAATLEQLARVTEQAAALTKERDELKAWQVEIGEGTAYINWAEGQGGYEVPPASVIVEAWSTLANEHADGHIELVEQIDHLEGIAENLQRDRDSLRTQCDALHARAQAAELRVAELEREAATTAERQREADALALFTCKDHTLAEATAAGISCAKVDDMAKVRATPLVTTPAKGEEPKHEEGCWHAPGECPTPPSISVEKARELMERAYEIGCDLDSSSDQFAMLLAELTR